MILKKQTNTYFQYWVDSGILGHNIIDMSWRGHQQLG